MSLQQCEIQLFILRIKDTEEENCILIIKARILRSEYMGMEESGGREREGRREKIYDRLATASSSSGP